MAAVGVASAQFYFCRGPARQTAPAVCEQLAHHTYRWTQRASPSARACPRGARSLLLGFFYDGDLEFPVVVFSNWRQMAGSLLPRERGTKKRHKIPAHAVPLASARAAIPRVGAPLSGAWKWIHFQAWRINIRLRAGKFFGGVFRVLGVRFSRCFGVFSCFGGCFCAVRLFILRVARFFSSSSPPPIFFSMELSKTGDCRPGKRPPAPGRENPGRPFAGARGGWRVC